jgi:hypothetical protein
MDDLPHSPAADRNKEAILAQLQRILGDRGNALEIASGTGQHAVFFAAGLPGWTWQATDADAGMLPALAARIARSGPPNLRPPLLLDVTAERWPSEEAGFGEPFDAIYCANMLHIAPWTACAGLMRGVARHLAGDGVLVTYGPYFEDGAPPAPSNTAFDLDLRSRNPQWGIRPLAEVALAAERAGLRLHERHAMPANNLLLVFRRADR